MKVRDRIFNLFVYGWVAIVLLCVTVVPCMTCWKVKGAFRIVVTIYLIMGVGGLFSAIGSFLLDRAIIRKGFLLGIAYTLNVICGFILAVTGVQILFNGLSSIPMEYALIIIPAGSFMAYFWHRKKRLEAGTAFRPFMTPDQLLGPIFDKRFSNRRSSKKVNCDKT